MLDEKEKLQLDTIELLLQRMTKTMEKVNQLDFKTELISRIPALCNTADLGKIKGVNVGQMQRRPYLLPVCGKQAESPDDHGWFKNGGKRVWKREDVIEWLNVTDMDLEDYAAKYGVDISRWFRNGKAVTGGELE